MKFLALLIILFNSNYGFSQKKIEYNIGIKYRITPIYMEPIQGIYFSEKNILIQQDKHLSGKSLINEFAYTFLILKLVIRWVLE